MKLIAIGDIHGKDTWKKIAKQPFDKFIFIGDYFDSFYITGYDQIVNFKQIISFKNKNPDKVVLLIGNHDYHYLNGVSEQYSGFQGVYQHEIQALLEKNIHLMQMAHKHDNLLFTHAGVTKTWLNNNSIDITLHNIDEGLNFIFKRGRLQFRFTPGPNCSNYGDDITQSPIWVRPTSLLKDPIDTLIQIVGHTSQEHLQITPNLILIDTLDTSKEYLVYENRKFKAETINSK